MLQHALLYHHCRLLGGRTGWVVTQAPSCKAYHRLAGVNNYSTSASAPGRVGASIQQQWHQAVVRAGFVSTGVGFVSEVLFAVPAQTCQVDGYV
jgi:hypothetical protein